MTNWIERRNVEYSEFFDSFQAVFGEGNTEISPLIALITSIEREAVVAEGELCCKDEKHLMAAFDMDGSFSGEYEAINRLFQKDARRQAISICKRMSSLPMKYLSIEEQVLQKTLGVEESIEGTEGIAEEEIFKHHAGGIIEHKSLARTFCSAGVKEDEKSHGREIHVMLPTRGEFPDLKMESLLKPYIVFLEKNKKQQCIVHLGINGKTEEGVQARCEQVKKEIEDIIGKTKRLKIELYGLEWAGGRFPFGPMRNCLLEKMKRGKEGLENQVMISMDGDTIVDPEFLEGLTKRVGRENVLISSGFRFGKEVNMTTRIAQRWNYNVRRALSIWGIEKGVRTVVLNETTIAGVGKTVLSRNTGERALFGSGVNEGAVLARIQYEKGGSEEVLGQVYSQGVEAESRKRVLGQVVYASSEHRSKLCNADRFLIPSMKKETVVEPSNQEMFIEN